jgi:hypothetical protein
VRRGCSRRSRPGHSWASFACGSRHNRIGASAGGLEALCKLAGSLPAWFPAAVIIVLHTSLQSPRLFAEIVGRCTSLPVSYGRRGDKVRPGHVYFAPPDYHLIVISPGLLGLDAGPKVWFLRPAADRLFQSAAEVYGPRVIGVILTGANQDRTDGLRLERIELYQLHAVDHRIPIEDSVGALVDLQRDGKIRHIGVSNVSERELARAAPSPKSFPSRIATIFATDRQTG